MQEKHEGDQKNCTFCSELLICKKTGMNDSNGNPYLGWFEATNPSKKHYNTKIKKGDKEFHVCEKEATQNQKTSEKIDSVSHEMKNSRLSLKNINMSLEDQTKINTLVSPMLTRFAYYEWIVTDFLKKSGDENPNPARVGMYMKLLVDELKIK